MKNPHESGQARAAPDNLQSRTKRKWSMSLINAALDAVLLVCVTIVGWITAMLYVVFPRPTLADGWTVWGLSFNQWHDVQFFALCMCAFGFLVHVMLHWNWVCSVLAAQVFRTKRPDDGAQTLYGVITLVVVLGAIGIALGAALLSVKNPDQAAAQAGSF